MGKIKLKPCPFCGGKAAFEKREMFAGQTITVTCKECEARGKHVGISLDYSAREMAAEKWNTRAQEEPEQERVVDIMDNVMGNICDEYCKYPDYLSDDALNAKCDECPFERLG